MLFSDSFIDELKQRLPISKVVDKRVKLKRYGMHLKGLCPFHGEKTPSFTVQDRKGMYYCFGCHASGDIIKFVSETEQLDFSDSVVYLTNLAGMELPKLNKTEQIKVERRLGLVELTTKAAEWFKKQLILTSNKKAYEYLQSRGIDDSDIQTFSIGYAPMKGLINFLEGSDFSLKMMEEAGLAIKTESNNYIERFRNRVMFPIKNQKNQIVGFGGRTLNDEIMPKYLNSPETALFKKNNLLYGAEIACKHSMKAERVIVVEGYLDTIFMHKAGFPETVASLGTAFNQTHLQNLWNLANEPILCFDGDEAGKKAMLKAAHTALPLLDPGLTLRFCFLPKGQDPDEVVHRNGAKYMTDLLNESMNLSDFIWQSELSQSTPDNPERKALFEQKIHDLVAQINNPIVRNHYAQFIQDKLWQEFSRFKSKKKDKTKIIHLKQSSLSLSHNLSIIDRLEYSLFAQLIIHPELIQDLIIFEDISRLEIHNKELETLLSIITKYHENQEILLKDLLIQNNLSKLVEFLCGTGSSFIDRISIKDSDTAKETWLITYKKYLLELLKTEYNLFMQKAYSENNALEKAEELKKSIDIIIKEITEKENNLV
jgi:DNA primase